MFYLLFLIFSVVTCITTNEKDQLRLIYDSTGGDGKWTQKWNFTENHCDFYGITCDKDGTIIHIELDKAGLQGALPQFFLPNLFILSIKNSYLSSIPDLSKLSQLQIISFNNNSLSGNITNHFSTLENLNFLDLSLNNLSGFPPIVVDSIEHLILNDNNYSGNFEYTTHTNLINLYLYNNKFSGELPDFTNFTKLQRIVLRNNSFSGSLPDLPDSVEQVDFSYNWFTNSIPKSYGNNIKLQSLSLNRNNLTGLIPAELSNLNSLKTLSINGNKFDNPLPESLKSLKSLKFFKDDYLKYIDELNQDSDPTPTQTGSNNDTDSNVSNDSVAIAVAASVGSILLLTSSAVGVYFYKKKRRRRPSVQSFSSSHELLLMKIQPPELNNPSISIKLPTTLSSTISTTNSSTRQGSTLAASTKAIMNYPIAIPGHSKIDFKTVINLGSKINSGGMSIVHNLEILSLTKWNEWKLRHELESMNELCIKVLTESTKIEPERFKFEVAVMDAVRKFSQNSVEIIGWSENPNSIIMKKYQNTLDSIIFNMKKNQKLKLLTIKNCLIDICSALTVCEQLGISHNDLKPHNILVNIDGSRINCYLTDYGCAELVVDRKLLKNQLTKAIEGLTPHYAAPELLIAKLVMFTKNLDQALHHTVEVVTKQYTQENVKNTIMNLGNRGDIFSFAIIAYEILFQRHAWGSMDVVELIQAVIDNKRPPDIPHMETIYKNEDANLFYLIYHDLIQKSWDSEYMNRPCFITLLEKLLDF